jgi:sporulation protein YlmC with PRC-barrel domain
MSDNTAQDQGNFQELKANNSSLQGLCLLKDLNKEDYEFSKYTPDVRGWKVVNGDSRKIGEVRDLVVDPTEMRIRYLDVEITNAEQDHYHVLIPVGAVIVDGEDDEIIANHLTRERLDSYPRYSGNNISREHERSLRSTWEKFNQNAIRSQMPGSHPDTGAEITPDFYQHSYFDEERFYGPRFARQEAMGISTFPEGEGRFALHRRRIG